MRGAVLSLALSFAGALECGPAVARRRAVVAGGAAALVAPGAAARADVRNAPVCANGVGDGCAELAGDSEFLRDLQRKSAEKRDERARAALDRYSVNNFNDYFAVANKALVRRADGTYEAVPRDAIAAGLRDGRIVYGGSTGGVADFATNRSPFAFAPGAAAAPADDPTGGAD